MAPPRAGTFIYHTHWHDPSQLTNGLYGPLIVLPPGEKFDPSLDLTFVFSIGDFGGLREMALINGTPQSKTLQLQTGKNYRFRLINISTNNQGMQVSLRGTNGPVEWLTIAKDGADLTGASCVSDQGAIDDYGRRNLRRSVLNVYAAGFVARLAFTRPENPHNTNAFVRGVPVKSEVGRCFAAAMLLG
jgi:hypothetical protein